MHTGQSRPAFHLGGQWVGKRSHCGPPIWIAGDVSGHRRKIGQPPSAGNSCPGSLAKWETTAKGGRWVSLSQAKGLSWKHHSGWAPGSRRLGSVLRGQLPTAAAGRCCVPLSLAGPSGTCSVQKKASTVW